MKNPTQKDRIIRRLLATGQISRNECLSHYISRLGAIICDLEKEGWEFEAGYDEKKDYVYKIVRTPYKKVIRTLSNGETIINYEK